MLKILVLEDDEESRKALLSLIGNIDKSLAADGASDLEGARSLLHGNTSYDLFLLDVNLDRSSSEDASGLIFAEEVRKIMKYELTPIVMLTSVAALEIEAYRKIHCYQYIIKPYDEEEVVQLVMKVHSHARPTHKPFVVVKKDGINYKILCEDIVYCKAIPRGICICLKKETLDVPYLSIRQLLEKLPKQDFFQSHRMFVVNRAYVKYYDFVNQVLQVEGYQEPIDIGVTYKAEIKRLMKE